MKTSLGSIQLETIIDKLLEISLKAGNLPQYYKIMKQIEKITVGYPLTKPTAFRDRQQLMKSTLEDIFKNILIDLDVLYNVQAAADDMLNILEAKRDISSTELLRLVTRLEELAATVTEDTVISNKFATIADINTDETTAVISLPDGAILPTTGLSSRRLILNTIYNVNFPINLTINSSIKYSSTDKFMTFYKPFWGEGAWRHEIRTQTPTEYIDVTFDIPLDKRMIINSIRFKSLTRMDIELYGTNDDTAINFVKLPSTGKYTNYGTYSIVSFPDTLCTMIRVKARVYVADSLNNKHVISFSDFGIYSTGYSKQADLVTKMYYIPDGTQQLVINEESIIPTGSAISRKIEFSDNTSATFRPNEVISVGTVTNDEEIVGIENTRANFITSNTYGTYNSTTFYKVPLAKCTSSGTVVDVKRGYNSMRLKTYTTRRTNVCKNIINPTNLNTNIQILYIPKEESKTSTALVTSTVNDVDTNGETHTYYIKLDNAVVVSPEMPLISSKSYSNVSFMTVQEKSDNASIYYIKAILTDGTEKYATPADLAGISEDRTTLFFDDFFTSSIRSQIQTIVVAYKAEQTNNIIPDSVSVVTASGVTLTNGKDYIIDYKNKQIVLKSTLDGGTLYIDYTADTGVSEFSEFSTNFYAPNTIDITLLAAPTLGTNDKLYVDGVQINTTKFPLLNPGYHTFLLTTDNASPLNVLYNALSIKSNDSSYVFFDLMSVPESNLSSMKIVDLDYLLYNTYRLDSNVCSITTISGTPNVIVPFVPYYYAGSNCIFPVSMTDNDGNDITTAAAFTTYISSNSERFRVKYNVVGSTTPEQFRLRYTLSKISDDVDVTPVLQGYEIHMR